MAKGSRSMKRIIQVGVGGMGNVWTERVAESNKWEAAAYVDSNEVNLLAAADKHGMPNTRCFTDVMEAINEVEAEALLDVTPQQVRRSVCTTALDRGLHVLSEKPLADTLKNAKAIVDKAAKQERIYMVAQNYRYQPQPQAARKFIAEQKLGAVGYAAVQFFKGPRFGGFREQMEFPLVLDMSIHHFDLMRCILDADVEFVSGVTMSAPWNWNKGDATAMLQLEMSNGAVVNYTGSWVSTGWETPWNANWRFEGEKGVLLWENDELWFSDKPDKRRKAPVAKMKQTHQAHLLDAFAKAIDTGEEPETSGRRNLNSLAATFAAVKAMQSKRRIRVSDLIK